ncbi:MAG: 2-polyprenyl-3-methyl-5-hydroxy-6-metoxy,4-benzoquinol methylase [Chlamydiia bacterium]|nr:2-polyprenyl-3-methyl-5-hydroxy-6-metoxy,4-benzoquinol methylase [Chlamydiia bacterium]
MERSSSSQDVINNEFYETLGERWYTAYDHPIALLRAENKVRGEWISHEIERRIGKRAHVLDVGCGAGFLTNRLAVEGYAVTGIDISGDSLEVARRHDTSKQVIYKRADAYALPFEDASFDVVCATDILEHVEKPELLIQEVSRVLRKDGIFFFHTFNRTFLSYLLVIKGVDWFVKNAPEHMHVYDLFITPEELKNMCQSKQLHVDTVIGLAPYAKKWSFWKMVFTRTVPEDFRFHFVKSLSTGYCGIAIKQ